MIYKINIIITNYYNKLILFKLIIKKVFKLIDIIYIFYLIIKKI